LADVRKVGLSDHEANPQIKQFVFKIDQSEKGVTCHIADSSATNSD
jgi:hypothetical protein